MPNKMLIDASHPEETRVVVTRGSRIEEFDFESQDKKQLKGNIYLARVTRVEPSLQAAFIEYGGNRHGFLAFSEIHPDYYQIPVADRQAILRAEAEAAQEDDEDDEDERAGRRGKRRGRGRGRDGEREPGKRAGPDQASSDQTGSDQNEQPEAMAADSEGSVAAHASDVEPEPAEGADVGQPDSDGAGESGENGDGGDDDHGGAGGSMAAAIETDSVSEAYTPESDDERGSPAEAQPAEHDAGEAGGRGEVEEVGSAGNGEEDGEVESVGAEDALEELPSRRRTMRKQYKIQEVIKRRQILLVQVVKEERGNKGAALTTYLSLAGRYSVLMPNTARGGGISRKITSALDRKRLKDVVKDLDVPQGMGVILRTAGANRTKPEIKRDYEYLMRMWENVRTLTLQSTAPALVYEEGSLIKRSVRDLYNKDIEEILVAGEEGYREAKDFMRMLMPSHAKMVQPYRDVVPIFARNGIEAQLDRMLQPQVTLKSGGYIIINQTEALVSIDVNSGRSTREHSIEDTALQTNLEAAEEVARQLRLRDLAGLIVIDFIDMEENRNNRSVEKRMKDCLKNDRARIQVGRISHFGLLEMSRQRIRSSVLESTTQVCPHCGGTGHVRSDSSVALHVVRAIEEFLLKDNKSHITVRTPTTTALYVLNQKRRNLTDLEARFGCTITIEADDTVGKQHHLITRGAAVEKPIIVAPVTATADMVEYEEASEEAVIIADEDEADESADEPRTEQARNGGEQDGDAGRKRKRRRRRRGGRDRDRPGQDDATRSAEARTAGDDSAPDDDEDGEGGASEAAGETAAEAGETEADAKKRRRGKRGGRRNRREDGEETVAAEAADDQGSGPGLSVARDGNVTAPSDSEMLADMPGDDAGSDGAELPASAIMPAIPVDEVADDVPEPAAVAPAKARRAPRARGKSAAAAEVVAAAEETAMSSPPAAETASDVAPEPAVAEKARASRRRPDAPDAPASPAGAVVTSTGAPAESDDKPKKAGWWQRRGFF